MNRKKIKSRCDLTQQALEDIMRINIDGTGFEDYDPLTPLQTWLNKGMRVRHLTHTTGNKKKPKNKDFTQLKPVCQIALPAIEDSQNDQNITPMEDLESVALSNCPASLVELNGESCTMDGENNDFVNVSTPRSIQVWNDVRVAATHSGYKEVVYK